MGNPNKTRHLVVIIELKRLKKKSCYLRSIRFMSMHFNKTAVRSVKAFNDCQHDARNVDAKLKC